MSNWIYNNKEYLEINNNKYIGFVYLITNLINNKKYIGRKNFGAKNHWKKYYGSCKELKLDIKKYGKENFKREILLFCESQAYLNYMEAKLQFENNVLESDNFYNGNIYIRAYKRNIINKK